MDSSHKKTILVSPDLFKVSGKRKTKKKTDGKSQQSIRMKPPSNHYANSSSSNHSKTAKMALLRELRIKQQQNYDELFQKTLEKHSHEPFSGSSAEKSPITITDIPHTKHSDISNNGKNSFQESIDFLNNMTHHLDNGAKHLQNKHSSGNSGISIRNYPTPEKNAQFLHALSGKTNDFPPKYNFMDETNKFLVSTAIPSPIQNLEMSNIVPKFMLPLPPPPKYGCLKNGTLPTYKTYMNTTRNHHHHHHNHPPPTPPPPPLVANAIGFPPNNQRGDVFQPHSATTEPFTQPNLRTGLSSTQTETNIIKQKVREHINNHTKPIHALKIPKRKKTLKRTFLIGKSGVYRKIGVLVKNRTIRNRISAQKQMLKQVPIDEIKMYLIKHGLIRVGTVSPDDVLRQIYESAILIGGELYNYNSDNLLYNYLNSK